MRYILLIILTLSTFNIKAQNDTTFFDAKWNVSSKKNASYFSLITKKGNQFIHEDFFISGQLQMTGPVNNPIDKVKNGKFTFYHNNGKKKSEGIYTNGLKEGKYIWYFKNGKKEAVENYSYGLLNGKYIEYFENGNTNYIVNYKNDKLEGQGIYYHENGERSQEGYFKNDSKNGKWNYWYEDGKYAGYEIYQSNFDLIELNLNINFKNNKWHQNKPDTTSDKIAITFKREPIIDNLERKVIPNISFVYEDINDEIDVIQYSTLKRIEFPFDVEKVIAFENKDLSMKNSIGYIGNYKYENGENHKITVAHTIQNGKGVQIIIDTTENTYKKMQSEIDDILKNIKAIK